MYCQAFSVQNIMHYFKLNFLFSEILILNLSTSGIDRLASYGAFPNPNGKLLQQKKDGAFQSHLLLPVPCLPGLEAEW